MSWKLVKKVTVRIIIQKRGIDNMVKTSLVVVKISERDDIYSKLYFHQNKKNSLVVIFPGGNYNCDRPLLHYARKASLDEGHDVLCMSYRRKMEWKDSGEYTIELQGDAGFDAIQKCMNKNYKNIYFVSKSIGTEIAGNISERMGYDKVTGIYLTPTKDAVKHIVNSKGAIVVGTEDFLLTAEEINKIKECSNIKLFSFKDANHSLEVDKNINESIRILSEIGNIYMNIFKN